MKRFLRMYRVEQRMFFRSPDVILFCLSMPLVTFIVIMLITGGKAAADSGLTYLESAYPVRYYHQIVARQLAHRYVGCYSRCVLR